MSRKLIFYSISVCLSTNSIFFPDSIYFWSVIQPSRSSCRLYASLFACLACAAMASSFSARCFSTAAARHARVGHVTQRRIFYLRSDVYVANLAVADFIFVSTIPFWAFDLMQDEWIFGNAACRVFSYITFLNMSSSILPWIENMPIFPRTTFAGMKKTAE